MARRSMTRQQEPSKPGEAEILTKEFVLPQKIFFQALVIVAAAIWIYWPSIYGDWISDDLLYVSNNSLMHDPTRLWKAWFQPGSFIEYYPIEESIQWLQYQLWGYDTLGYHLTNVGLHILNAFLVWHLLGKFGLKSGWLGALLFTVHPLMVESVAWMSELKNTLSLGPTILAMCAWIDYEERGRRGDYLRSLAWFLVAMLCKISAAPVAPVLLLYAWWKRGRLTSRDVLASIPFFVIAVGLGELSKLAGQIYIHRLMVIPEPIDLGGFLPQFLLAGQCLAFYFVHFIWPFDPLPIYPQWKVDPTAPLQYVPWLILAGVVAGLWFKRRTWGRHVLLGLGFFIITVAPYIGIFKISYLSQTWVVDHMMYLPILGLIGLVVAGVDQWEARLTPTVRPIGTGIVTIILVIFAYESHWYSAAFTDAETLGTYTVGRNPAAWSARDGLGKVLLRANKPEEALEQFQAVILLKPNWAEPYNNLAMALATLGRTSESQAAFQESLRREPNANETHNNYGILLARTGHYDEAIQHFRAALYHHPNYADAHNNLGNALLLSGHPLEAAQEFATVLEISPNNLFAHLNLGLAFEGLNRKAEAMDQFKLALQIDPRNGLAQDHLAKLEQEPAPTK